MDRTFAIRVGPAFNNARRACGDRLPEWDPVADKIADLFMVTNTKRAEVAATVQFAARE